MILGSSDNKYWARPRISSVKLDKIDNCYRSEGLTIACGPGSNLQSPYICCPGIVLANENIAL
jgi:hypothetical protein